VPTSVRSHADQLQTIYPFGHLFGPWEQTPARSHQSSQDRRSSAGRAKSGRERKRLVASRYGTAPGVHGGARGRGDVEQQVRTVREVMLARLDDLGATDLWPIAEGCGLSWDGWIQMYQRMLLSLFPEECGDGEGYTPDPACREGVPPGAKARKGGLFPHPCEGVGDERSLAFARHFLRGQGSPAAGMTMPDGSPLFTDSDLAVLGERMVKRETGRTA
jgi:hypothetical protein